VLFGLVDLLLQQASRATEPDRRTALLREARDQLEELKSAELVEYFQDACLAPQIETRVEEIPGAVVVYPVLLPDRTEFIVSRGEAIENVVIPISAGELEPRIHRLRALLQKRTTRQYRPAAADLYDVLMRPLLNTLGDAPVDALVFVPGGALRTIPMGALYDRQERRFLVEKYPLAVIPALKLTDPRPLDRERVRTLSAGLTLPVQGFPALMSVQSEIIAVDEIFEGRSLMDDEFVLDAVEQSLGDDQYDIVHIATHGQFRARASDSFLLTYDGKLSLDRLAVLVERTRYRDRPIELLTLSACETAVGDDRAALGLAGVAVRAGARSALATLWTVNDQAAADLIAEFYRQLSLPEVSKAVALQRAQIKLLESRPYGHPGYWAPFLLISNWM
jgi:CHAT domain-containing protein